MADSSGKDEEHPNLSSLLLERLRTNSYRILRSEPSPSLIELIPQLDEGSPCDGNDALQQAAVSVTLSCLYLTKLVYEYQAQRQPGSAAKAAALLDSMIVNAHMLHEALAARG